MSSDQVEKIMTGVWQFGEAQLFGSAGFSPGSVFLKLEATCSSFGWHMNCARLASLYLFSLT